VQYYYMSFGGLVHACGLRQLCPDRPFSPVPLHFEASGDDEPGIHLQQSSLKGNLQNIYYGL
jgi:hypothetical protein